MLIAAWIALFKDDLKALLAFSTVSHLGLITMLFGMGTPIAAVAAVFHILNHATFKAALFLCAGIVDHETGTRDARRLGGLLWPDADHRHAGDDRRRLHGRPAAAQRLSVQGDDARGRGAIPSIWACPGWCRCWRPWRTLFSVAYSFRFVTAVFLGPARDDYPHHPHDPPAGMWLPVAVLVVPVVVIGMAPLIAGRARGSTSRAVVGGRRAAARLLIWRSGTA